MAEALIEKEVLTGAEFEAVYEGKKESEEPLSESENGDTEEK